MKKLVSTIIMAVLLVGFMNSPVQAQPQPQPTPSQDNQKIELTEKQEKEVKKLHKKMYETKKELINKYIEYGVLSKEKGSMILTKMEEHYKKMQENGYIPNWERHHHQH